MILKSRKHFIVMGEGRGCGEEGEGWGTPTSRTLQSRIPPPLFVTSVPLSFFFRLQNIDHCCVISPISNTINGLILEIRESTVGYLWFRLRRGGGGGVAGVGNVVQGSKPPAPTPCIPGSLFFALIFYA